MIDQPVEDYSNDYSWRTYTRLASAVVSHARQANGIGGPPLGPTGEVEDGGDSGNTQADPKSTKRRKPTRRQRMARETHERWAVRRYETLEALRELRAETLPAPGSPDFASAALFAPPALSEIGDAAEVRVDPEVLARVGAGEQLDEDEALLLARLKLRLYYLARRYQHMEARQLRPHNCWRNLGSAGERGGLRASQRAYPAAWGRYLLRYDADGLDGGQWSSPLGCAWRHIERDYAATPLVRVLWAYCDPVVVPVGAFDAVVRTLPMAPGRVERWLEAGARRMEAEMVVALRGRERCSHEQRAADQAEARAWEGEATC